MSKLKATKRLITAIAALVASVVLCIGVCLAWFSAIDRVSGGGMSESLKQQNIESFTVTAYTLEELNDDGGAAYKKGDKVTGDPVSMKDYGSLNGTTALLLEISYKFREVSNRNYGIFADCNRERVLEQNGTDENQTINFKSNLSDAVTIYRAVVDAEGKVSLTENGALEFTDDSGGEIIKDRVVLNGSAITDADTDIHTIYAVIDYNELHITTLYARALNEGGTLNSQMVFNGDITFYIEETVGAN